MDVYEPEVIQETPFPQEEAILVSSSESDSSGGASTGKTIQSTSFPTRKVAVELLSTVLNTKSRKILKEFELQDSGALKIGNYQSGETGELKITPDGLTARNSAGITTFAIDGDTGEAVFKGSIQAGSIITGLITVGDNRIIIDGESKQIIINDGEYDRVLIGYQQNGF